MSQLLQARFGRRTGVWIQLHAGRVIPSFRDSVAAPGEGKGHQSAGEGRVVIAVCMKAARYIAGLLARPSA